MKISYNWLKNYVPDLPRPEIVADTFTFHICEVEGVEKLANGDSILDIKVLPDRAHDLLSHRGIARDLAALLGLSYNDVSYTVPAGERTKLAIKVETENCRRYMGRVVRNVKVGISPDWIKNYLESIGQHSINNLVDASNIVMFDRGNPIHVFDLDKLASEKIIIRAAREGEEITTLDGKQVKLNSNNMVIADETEALVIAGIKGGKKAEVDENTKNIMIEVANFNPANVRKTSRQVNIYTDAVKRFENDLSPEVAPTAMNDIAALILEMCPEAQIEEVVDVYPKKQEKKTLNFSVSKISKILGLPLTVPEAEKIFKQYGYIYKNNGDEFEMEVLFNRPDLAIPEDMAEEIGRKIGYDKIEATLPNLDIKPSFDDRFTKIAFAREKLLSEGFSEVMTYTFRDKGEVEVLASASDKKFLRTNLTDGLRESLKLNQLNAPLLEMNQNKIFEIGTVFKKGGEEMHVVYNEKKEIKEMTLEEFVAPAQKNFSAFLQPSVGPFCQRNFSVPAAHTDLVPEEKASDAPKRFVPWSIYPFISRDVAVWVEKKEDREVLEKILKENGTKLLIKEPYLFDSFTKDGKTSYAFRLVFQSYDRTLTDSEVSEIMTKINQKISEHPDWKIR